MGMRCIRVSGTGGVRVCEIPPEAGPPDDGGSGDGATGDDGGPGDAATPDATTDAPAD